MSNRKRILILGETFLEWFIPWLKVYQNEIHVIASQETESLALVDRYLVNPVIKADEIIRYIQQNQIEGIISKVDTNKEFQFIRDAAVKEYADRQYIPFFGQNLRSAIISMDKSVQRLIFEAADIPMPKGFIINNKEELLRVCDQLRFPLVLKKPVGSANQGVFFVEKRDELLTTYEINKMDNMIIEEFVTGQEVGLQAWVMDGKIQSIQNVYLGETSIRNNPHSRFRIAPGLAPELQQEAEKLIKKLVEVTEANGIIQVDCVYNPEYGRFFVFEVNNRINGMCDLVSFSSGLNVFKNAVLYSMGIKEFDMEDKLIAVEIPLRSLEKRAWGLQTFVKASRVMNNTIIVLIAANNREELIRVTRNIPMEEKLYDQEEFEQKIMEINQYRHVTLDRIG